MARIIKVLYFDDKDTYGVVYVLLDDGTEAEVFVGGEVVVWFDPIYNRVKAFVKPNRT